MDSTAQSNPLSPQGQLGTPNWQPIYSAPVNQPVLTKIDDAHGVRNEQPLKRRGRLWFFPDDIMYVYYTPTHWKALND